MTSELEGKGARKRSEKRRSRSLHIRQIDIADVDWHAFGACLVDVLERGGALRLGATRDGGAWAIGIYGLDESPYTEYVRADEDINEFFRGLGDDFQGLKP